MEPTDTVARLLAAAKCKMRNGQLTVKNRKPEHEHGKNLVKKTTSYNLVAQISTINALNRERDENPLLAETDFLRTRLRRLFQPGTGDTIQPRPSPSGKRTGMAWEMRPLHRQALKERQNP